MDGILRFNCTGSDQEDAIILLQPDVGMGDNNETTSQQAAAREEFAIPTKKRQQQGMTAWSAEQNKQFDRGRSTVNHYFSEERMYYRMYCLLVFSFVLVCFLLLYFSCLVRNFPKQVRKAMGAIGMYQMRVLLYQGKSMHRHLDLR